MTGASTGFGAVFFGGPEDGERKSIKDFCSAGSPPPELMVADGGQVTYTEAEQATPVGPPFTTGLYAATGRRQVGPDLEVRYEWRGWQ